MKPIKITDVGPITELSIPVPDRGGVIVLRGRNRAGKSTAIRAVRRLCGSDDELSLRDGALKGEVTGFGARFTVGKKSVRKDAKLELLVEALEGYGAADLVDPGVSDPVKADAARIKALVSLTGQEADATLFHSLSGGREEFERLCPGIDIGEADLLRLASLVKREFERAARESETARDTAEGARQAAEAAIGNLKLDGETDEKILQANLEAAIRHQTELQTQVDSAALSRTAADEAKAKLDESASGEKQISHSEAFALLEAALREEEEAHAAFEAAEKRRDAAVANSKARAADSEAAKAREKTLADCKAQIDSAATVACPSDDQLASASQAVSIARKAVEDGALIRNAKLQRAAAIRHTTDVAAHSAAATRLRKAAAGIDGLLSGLVAKVGGGLSVKDGRLILQTDRGQVYYGSKEDVSDGQRWRVAIDIIVESFRKVHGHETLCTMTLEQAAWAELDPVARQAIHEHACKLGVWILTAEATGDEELRAEAFTGDVGPSGKVGAELETIGA